MADVQHRELGGASIHVPHKWTYANAAAREAATGFIADDLHKLALQDPGTSNATLWLLIDTAGGPTGWVQVGGGSSTGGETTPPVAAAGKVYAAANFR